MALSAILKRFKPLRASAAASICKTKDVRFTRLKAKSKKNIMLNRST
jgi:hypothetical protein